MPHYTLDSSIHGGQDAAKERDALDRAAEYGEHDARSNLTCDPMRHHLHCLEASEYNRSFDAERTALIAHEDRRRVLAAKMPETVELVRATLQLMGLDARLPALRFKVVHRSGQHAILNPGDEGFADYDSAAVRRDQLLEDASLLIGDYITIEDQGCIVELHEHIGK